MYPDTTCFYRAQVLESPKVTQRDKVGWIGIFMIPPAFLISFVQTLASGPIYRLKFEDDESPQHLVSAYWVVPWPTNT